METSLKETSHKRTFSISKTTEKHLSMIGLEVAFFSAIFGISVLGFEIPTRLIPLFCLAVFRMACTISFNEIMEWLREPFTEVIKDSSGAGANVHPKGEGFRYAIGSLLSCPICTGTWCALVLLGIYTIYEPLGITMIWVFGLAGASEATWRIVSFFEWAGRLARVSAGSISPDKE
jgi:hypothetical protein